MLFLELDAIRGAYMFYKHLLLYCFSEYNIEVYTGKKQMAGTDANIYIVISGENGTSRKVHLADNTKDKKLFEKNSVDKFRIRMHSLGNLQNIRIEHDGKGMGAGWFLDRVSFGVILGPYSPTILKNILCLFLQDFVTSNFSFSHYAFYTSR